MSVEQVVVEKLKTLSPDKQQEVLDFVEFLESRTIKAEPMPNRWEGMTALEAAERVMEPVEDGPPDLSTNPQYMNGFGE
jgi:Protein of unknown function (DUF2281)